MAMHMSQDLAIDLTGNMSMVLKNRELLYGGIKHNLDKMSQKVKMLIKNVNIRAHF